MAPLFDITLADQALSSLLSVQCPSVDITPLFLATSPTERQRRAVRLNSVLVDVIESISLVSLLEGKVLSLLRKLEAWRAEVTQPLAPISALPVELLRPIFEMAVEEGGWRSSVRLSHVCSRWRAVSVNHGQLWSELDIHQSSQSRIMSLFAHRSANTRLHLSLREPHPGAAFLDIIDVDAAEARQIRALTFETHEAYYAFQIDQNTQATMDLESVEFNFNIGAGPVRATDYLATTRRLRFRNATVTANPISTFARLTDLTIRYTEEDAMIDMLKIIQAPALQSLKICEIEPTPVEVTTRVTFPLLTSLSIEDVEPGGWASLRSLLIIPNLHHLAVGDPGWWVSGYTDDEIGIILSDLVSGSVLMSSNAIHPFKSQLLPLVVIFL